MELFTFGSEVADLRTAQYIVRLMCYKLIIMGVLIDAKAKFFNDNKSFWESSIRMNIM